MCIKELSPRVNLTILSASCRSGGMLDVHRNTPGVLLAACHETQINVKAVKTNTTGLQDPWTWAILKVVEAALREQQGTLSYRQLFHNAKARISLELPRSNLTPTEQANSNFIQRGKYFGPSPNPTRPTPWTGPRLEGYQDPQLVYNDLYVDVNDDVFYPAPPGVAFYKLPCGSEVHLFSGSQSAQITINESKRSMELATAPQDIATTWPSLTQAGFSRVDAVLTRPGSDSDAYFFSGTRYVVINVKSDARVAGPQTITAGWASLAAAGFRRVDAVLPNPDNANEAYFFSGTRYALINVATDAIANGPKDIVSEWPSLSQAGFSTVDALFAIFQRNIYVFSGKEYVLIHLIPGTTDDNIINGPAKVNDYWPSIRHASAGNTVVAGERAGL